jgi:hypothetical protein
MGVCWRLEPPIKRSKTVTRTAKSFIAVLLLCLPALTLADELTDAAQGLCDNIKSCALEQFAKEDMTPELRQMMQPMLENMCVNLQSQVKTVPPGHPCAVWSR